LSSTNPTLLKLAKTTTEDNFPEDTKVTHENEIKEIVEKYDDLSYIQVTTNDGGLFNIQRDFDADGDAKSKIPEIAEIDSKNKIKIPVLNLRNINSKSSRENQEENLFDPATERDCSFINNISVDNSNFVDDLDNKENEVVLCISSLDIENSISTKKLPISNILQSEEKTLHDEISDFNKSKENVNEKRKLIDEIVNNQKNKVCNRKALIIFLLIFLLVLSGFITYVYILGSV
jgi:hypothetical protein